MSSPSLAGTGPLGTSYRRTVSEVSTHQPFSVSSSFSCLCGAFATARHTAWLTHHHHHHAPVSAAPSMAVHSRLWWRLSTVCVAGIGEILGWSARLWSSQNVYLNDPFIMHACHASIIRRIGQKHSRVSAKWYTIIFCAADVIALVIQPVGGGSPFWTAVDAKNPETGGHIMLAGVSFQMGTSPPCQCSCVKFRRLTATAGHSGARGLRPGIRVHPALRVRPPVMLLGLVLEAVFLFVRGIYRVVELSNGWTGKIITTEWYFVVFDGTMIMLAMLTLNIFHPGLLLGNAHTWLSRESEEEIKAKEFDKESV
ncbi:RTA1 like protein [Ganoderma leucocontextum]|nr:RTA1 like protein [Ganoderma leucocontextum]